MMDEVPEENIIDIPPGSVDTEEADKEGVFRIGDTITKSPPAELTYVIRTVNGRNTILSTNPDKASQHGIQKGTKVIDVGTPWMGVGYVSKVSDRQGPMCYVKYPSENYGGWRLAGNIHRADAGDPFTEYDTIESRKNIGDLLDANVTREDLEKGVAFEKPDGDIQTIYFVSLIDGTEWNFYQCEHYTFWSERYPGAGSLKIGDVEFTAESTTEDYRKHPEAATHVFEADSNDTLHWYEFVTKFSSLGPVEREWTPRCSLCRSESDTDFHHWDYENHIGIMLCRDCHMRIHEGHRASMQESFAKERGFSGWEEDAIANLVQLHIEHQNIEEADINWLELKFRYSLPLGPSEIRSVHSSKYGQ